MLAQAVKLIMRLYMELEHNCSEWHLQVIECQNKPGGFDNQYSHLLQVYFFNTMSINLTKGHI